MNTKRAPQKRGCTFGSARFTRPVRPEQIIAAGAKAGACGEAFLVKADPSAFAAAHKTPLSLYLFAAAAAQAAGPGSACVQQLIRIPAGPECPPAAGVRAIRGPAGRSFGRRRRKTAPFAAWARRRSRIPAGHGCTSFPEDKAFLRHNIPGQNSACGKGVWAATEKRLKRTQGGYPLYFAR